MKTPTAQQTALKAPKLMVILRAQSIVLLVIASISVLLSVDKNTVLSLVVGASIFIGPNAYFSYYAFRYSGARAATRVAQSFYQGEAGKFVMTVVLFATVFATLKPINVIALFLAYIFFMVLTWLLAWQATK